MLIKKGIDGFASALVIDLDGTLIRSDMLYESFIDALFHRPGRLLRSVPSLFLGRAVLKRTLASIKTFDPSALPYRQEILDIVTEAKAKGSKVFLVTAADQSIANAVADHFGVFDGAKGSDGLINLKGQNKLEYLRETFPQGFAYAGDSAADLPIWEAADRAILVGKGVLFADRLRELDIEVETISSERATPMRDWLTEFRIHQWSKNLLLFVPLLLGHLGGDLAAVTRTLVAFFAFGLIASGSYILNDLADLKADRAHGTKRFRAVASGRISVVDGLSASAALILSGLTISFGLGEAFATYVLIYLSLTLLYSFRLKRYPLFDVTLIGVLFTLRILMGTSLHAALSYSPWLTAFSVCFFFSLALAKRHVEVMRAQAKNLVAVKGRGYRADDWPLTLALGVASSMASVIIMLMFVVSDAGSVGTYSHINWLYSAPAGVFLWTQRIWLLSHRKELHDDPIVFALKDRLSYAIGAMILLSLLIAL